MLIKLVHITGRILKVKIMVTLYKPEVSLVSLPEHLLLSRLRH